MTKPSAGVAGTYTSPFGQFGTHRPLVSSHRSIDEQFDEAHARPFVFALGVASALCCAARVPSLGGAGLTGFAAGDEVLVVANSDEGETALGDVPPSACPQPHIAPLRQAMTITVLCRATMARNKALSAARRKSASGITSG